MEGDRQEAVKAAVQHGAALSRFSQQRMVDGARCTTRNLSRARDRRGWHNEERKSPMLTARQAELLKSLPRDGVFSPPAVGEERRWAFLTLVRDLMVTKAGTTWHLTEAGRDAWDELNKQETN